MNIAEKSRELIEYINIMLIRDEKAFDEDYSNNFDCVQDYLSDFFELNEVDYRTFGLIAECTREAIFHNVIKTPEVLDEVLRWELMLIEDGMSDGKITPKEIFSSVPLSKC